jgi:hypothetical protein
VASGFPEVQRVVLSPSIAFAVSAAVEAVATHPVRESAPRVPASCCAPLSGVPASTGGGVVFPTLKAVSWRPLSPMYRTPLATTGVCQ